MSNQIDIAQSPYYNDYDETKRYIRILFKPGVSVQARELQNLQSMIQKQISRMGNHLFQNGSMVIPGNIVPDFNYRYVKIEDAFADGATEDITAAVIANYVGKRVKSKTGTLVGLLRNYQMSEGSDPVTLYVDYQNQGGAANDETVFTDGETLSILDDDDSTLREVTVQSSSATGIGSAVHLKTGVYYVNEYFHYVADETLIISKYSNTPSVSVGFTVTDEIITSSDDTSLLDPAVGSNNTTAPGADRYKSTLALSTKTLDTSGTQLGTNETGNYVQLMRVVDGVVQSQVRTPSYNILGDTLAKRSDDTNGSFIIDPFTLSFEPHLQTSTYPGRFTAAQGGDATKFVYVLDKGEAYIKGYNIKKDVSTYIAADRARTTKERNNVPTPCDLGQYVIGSLSTSDDALPSLQDYPVINIQDDSSTPANIGTCRIRAIRAVSGDDYRFYIFAISMNTGKTFIEDAKRLQYTDATYGNFDAILEQVSSKAVVYEPIKTPAIFPIAYSPMESVLDVSYTTQESMDEDAASSQVVYSTGASNRTFTTSNLIVVNITDGTIVASANYTASLGVANTQLTLTGAGITTGKRYRIFVDVTNVSVSDATAYNLRTKTVTTKDLTGVTAASEISLTVADAYKVEVTDAVTSLDVSYKYRLDTGQRDGYYAISKLVLVPGETQSNDLDITVTYFAHGAGDYFAANSYSSSDYAKIQFYKASNGEIFDLTNCLDFRPTIATDGTFTSAGANTGNNIAPESLFSADLSYYIGRYDRIIMNSDGTFEVLTGTPDDFPTPPENKTSGIVLHEVKVPAYTYDIKNIRAKAIEHRRYRMKDIAKLEKRIENVEYYTALSLLEKDTSDLILRDSSGNDKFKNGFLTDNFANQSNADIYNDYHNFAVDIDYGEGHPEVSTVNVMLANDSGNTSDLTVHDNGIVTLDYTETTTIAQGLATGSINVNPYAMYVWNGTMNLTPSSDIWFSTNYAPDVIVDGGVVDNVSSSNTTGTVWNNWQTTWTGTENDVLSIESERVKEWRGGSVERSLEIHREIVRAQNAGVEGAESADAGRFRWVTTETATIAQTTTSIQQRTGTQTFVSSSVQRRVIDDRVVSQAVIPWIRGRRVSFVASGLKPSSKHWCYFDEVDVSAYCAQTGPDTSRSKGTYLVTNDAGQVEGYFDIPNTSNVRFRTGTRLFEIVNSDDLTASGIDSFAEATYHADGTLTTRQKTIESTRVSRLVTRSVSQRRQEEDTENLTFTRETMTGWLDPIAQSFLTDIRGGCFITSIEIPFTAKDDSLPVTLQVRNMDGGFPGVEILPFSEVTLYPASITADSSGVTYSKFTFDAPVFIQEGIEYCFVLISNSNDYQVRLATMGEQDITTGTYVSKQPYMGVFFKSQNGTTWSPDQDSDMTFKINRAVFSPTSGTLRAIPSVPTYEDGFEADPFNHDMYTDPFEALSGSQTIKVFHKNHGMYPGNEVVFNIPEDTTTSFGGIDPQADIDEQTLTVSKVINADEYYIDLSANISAATDSGRFGGAGVTATTNVAYDILQLNAQTLIQSGTSLTAKIKTTDHNTVASRAIDTAFTEIGFNRNIYFGTTRSLIEDESDFQLEVDFTTDNAALSPVLDLDRLSGFFSRNRINDIEDNSENSDYDSWVTYFSDANDASSTEARYIAKTVVLDSPATDLHVFLDVNRRSGSDIEVWYKAAGVDDSTDIDDLDWVQMTADTYPSISSIVGEFKEYEWKVEGLDEYTSFKVKVLLKASSTASAPSVKNFRAIATAS